MENQQTYDQDKAIAAQRQYCAEHKAPFFAMRRCYRCNQNIYAENGHPIERLPRGKSRILYGTTLHGISVESAGISLICGCPFCHASFDD